MSNIACHLRLWAKNRGFSVSSKKMYKIERTKKQTNNKKNPRKCVEILEFLGI